MEKKLLKTALFGYSKASVCEYIAQVNEEFSENLMAVSEENRIEREELKAKLAASEEELSEYKKAYGDIAAALLEAQQYASGLKEKAEEEYRRLSARNAERLAAQNIRIDSYRAEIDAMRDELRVFAADTDKKLQAYLEKTAALKDTYGEDGETPQ